jgi:transglutaminase-like putative cysteine protease
VTHAREKRLLLGLLALVAPLPLPFNEVVSWPGLALFLTGVLAFLRRAAVDRSGWLPLWALNLLGLAYVPWFLFDLLVLSAGRLVGPVVHLGLFTVVVKLFSLLRERDKWQALMGVFFLFLASMATSVHPSVVLFLLVFLGLVLLLLSRFAFLHLVAVFEPRRGAPPRVPFGGFLTVSLLLAVIVAVPLFALLPRVRSPFLFSAPGGGLLAPQPVTGFSDEVGLDFLGRVRTSREVALRFRPEGQAQELETAAGELRFKASAFDSYRNHRWVKSPSVSLFPQRGARRPLSLTDDTPTAWGEVFLRPLASRSLVLPVQAVALEGIGETMEISRGGALQLPVPPQDVLRYRVGLVDRPLSFALPPEEGGQADGTLDPGGVSEEMAELALRVMGEGTSRERVERLERHLITDYSYTLDLSGRSGGHDPIGGFLFRYKSGHCELFASSMVLLLRSQGVPARLVTGFLGAEYNPLEGYFIVRQSNAHAWVEAYLAEEGAWVAFDPTPPAGRPGGGRTSFLSLMLQTYDYLLFRWDRYVLSYDFGDQLRVVGSLRQLWEALWRRFERGPGAEPSLGPVGEEPVTPTPAEPAEPRLGPWGATALGFLVLALTGGLIHLWRKRVPPSATAAYRRLRRELSRRGVPVTDTDPPLAVQRSLGQRFPRSAAPAGRIFALYLQESFAGRELQAVEREELGRSLAETLRGFYQR